MENFQCCCVLYSVLNVMSIVDSARNLNVQLICSHNHLLLLRYQIYHVGRIRHVLKRKKIYIETLYKYCLAKKKNERSSWCRRKFLVDRKHPFFSLSLNVKYVCNTTTTLSAD